MSDNDKRKYLQSIYGVGATACTQNHKELLKLNRKKMNNQLKEWAKALSRHFTKDVQVAI